MNNTRVLLASRPVGLPTRDNWTIETVPAASPGEGEFLAEQGNPADTDRFLPMLDRHIENYGKAPRQVAADGGPGRLHPVPVV